MSEQKKLPDVVDIVVVGSGIGGLSAAVTANSLGLEVLVIEKDCAFGGASARSGGTFWLPGSAQARAAGLPDDHEEAAAYLDAVVGKLADPALRRTFLARAPEALAYLEANSELAFDLRQVSPDYHPEMPNASERGRVLDVRAFDGRRLGARFADLRPPIETHVLFGGMSVNRQDVQILQRVLKSPSAMRHAARLMLRYLWDRTHYPRGTRLVLGSAAVARLASTLFSRGVRLELNCPATELLRDSRGGIFDVLASPQGGTSQRIRTRCGVVLAAGGFSADVRMSEQYRPGSVAQHVSMLPDSCSGDGVRLGETAGGELVKDGASAFFWSPVSLHRRRDGTIRRFAHLTTDRAKPGVIAVNRRGERFTNEADSYHRFGAALQPLARESGEGPIAYLICDARCLRRYGLGIAKPFPAHLPNRRLIADGYLIEAPSIDGLAERIGTSTDTLRCTVRRHNAAAEVGVDEAFGKGGSSHNRTLGDAQNKPNPCLAAIKTAPYYAIALHSGDLGTAVGLRTDGFARVLSATNGAPIPGLYAVGNDMQSIMGGVYPGPGITLGPALVFGYLAARDLTERSSHNVATAAA